MRTGAIIFACGFILGSLIFSNGGKLEAMRLSREDWRMKAETAQTDLYHAESKCGNAQSKLEKDYKKQINELETTLKLQTAEIENLESTIGENEEAFANQVEQYDAQMTLLRENAADATKRNNDLNVLQNTAIHQLEATALENKELLEILIKWFEQAGEQAREEAEGEFGTDDAQGLFEAVEVAEVEEEPMEYAAEPVEEYEEEDQEVEVEEAPVGFQAPPRAVANAHANEEAFHQQLKEDAELVDEAETLGFEDDTLEEEELIEDGPFGMDGVVEDEIVDMQPLELKEVEDKVPVGGYLQDYEEEEIEADEDIAQEMQAAPVAIEEDPVGETERLLKNEGSKKSKKKNGKKKKRRRRKPRVDE